MEHGVQCDVYFYQLLSLWSNHDFALYITQHEDTAIRHQEGFSHIRMSVRPHPNRTHFTKRPPGAVRRLTRSTGSNGYPWIVSLVGTARLDHQATEAEITWWCEKSAHEDNNKNDDDHCYLNEPTEELSPLLLS